jgi:hypothetical protein
MSVIVSTASLRAYDLLLTRPGATKRTSGARDMVGVNIVKERLHQLIGEYRITVQTERGNHYVFWVEIEREIRAGTFDDLLDRF